MKKKAKGTIYGEQDSSSSCLPSEQDSSSSSSDSEGDAPKQQKGQQKEQQKEQQQRRPTIDRFTRGRSLSRAGKGANGIGNASAARRSSKAGVGPPSTSGEASLPHQR